jgi:flagellar basal body-associated protein FliL
MDTTKNKKQGIFLILMMVLLVMFEAAAQAQPPQTPALPKGLLTRLIEIKYGSELYLSSKIKSENISIAQKDTALATYNTLRWLVDGFVYQLSSEMIANNSPRQWRKLNEWCLRQKNKPAQLEAFQNIQNFYAVYIAPSIIVNTKTLNLTTNVFYLLKDSYTIIQGIADMKTQKTMALIELMDHTRLLSVGELGKGVK